MERITKSYPRDENKDGIVFFEASNFRLWTKVKEDLSAYKVVNSGFGGSTDKLLAHFFILMVPSRLLPNESNNYVFLEGEDEEKVLSSVDYKKGTFVVFHKKNAICLGCLSPNF